MKDQYDDYRYSDEAREVDLKLIWMCNSCSTVRHDYPSINEGGQCVCGGEFVNIGESYRADV